MSISINIPLSGNGCNSEINTANNDNSKYIDWNNHSLSSSYCKHVSAFTDKIIIPKNYCDISTMEQAQFCVDEYCKNITEALHEAADAAVSSMVKSKSIQKSRHFRKHWRSQDCRIARDRNRFWFSLWRSCDRPRQGVIYETYKYTKHVFREICRQNINKCLRFTFDQCDKPFKEKCMGEFWRNIRKSRNPLNSNNKSIPRDALETRFTEKFSYDKINENESISAARNTVRMKLTNCMMISFLLNID